MSPIKILCCGDRNWNNIELIETTLGDVADEKGVMHEDLIIIEGECNGADKQSKVAALRIGVPRDNIKEYPAYWKHYGRSAGPIRNSQMLKENPDIDLVLAFHNDLENSKGTKDMVKKAERKGIKVRVIQEKRM